MVPCITQEQIMSIYTSTARFDGSARALTEVELRKVAPSIFAIDPHESRSERFRAIPTWTVLQALMKEGFSPVGAMQSTTRDASKRNHTKHMLRLRRLDEQAKYSVGDNIFEMILKNANDGTAQYELMGGMFRIRCLNSLVAQTNTIDTVKVRHSGDVAPKVVEGTFRVLEEAEAYLAAPQDWSRIQLAKREAEVFAEAAHEIRFADAEGEVHTPIQPRQLLIPRRSSDTSPDLWTVFNVVQENSVKGGLSARNENHRRVTTRTINGIDQNVRVNKALWMLAEKMAELKA
jgi:hypothetical protein